MGRYYRIWGRILLCVALSGCGGIFSSQNANQGPSPHLEFAPTDRILILAPHPDDEIVGCGGIIQEAMERHLPLRIVFLTYGDGNEWSFLVYRKHPVLSPKAVQQMGLLRRDEAVSAAAILGLSERQLTFLGYPDFGTLQIWSDHWKNRPPLKGLMTQVTEVPYGNAFRPGAPYKGEEVLSDLKTILKEFRPTKIFVSHPADHNPDHRALYLFTRVALWDLEPQMRPTVYPYLVHFGRWPKPKGYRPERRLTPPGTLTARIPWRTHPLGNEAVSLKKTALRQHKTQVQYRGGYLFSFVRANELFGDFPVIRLNPDHLPGTSTLEPSVSQRGGEIVEELTDEERALFVGVERETIRREDGHLVLSIGFSRPLAEAVEASVYVFGYRKDTPFADMPKLHIRLGEFGQAMYDQNQKLPKELLAVTRRPRQIIIRIPLSAAGNPHRILTGARTYMGEVPLGWTSWRVVELSAHTMRRSR